MTPNLTKTTGFYDAKANFNELKQFVDEKGWDQFLTLLQETWPERELGAVSQSWADESEPKYICKAKGRRGDIIIGWSENDYGKL